MTRTLLAFAACLPLALATGGAANAQSNEVFIDQTGAGNSIFIDQSAATGSSVRGLTITGPTLQSFTDSDDDPVLTVPVNVLDFEPADTATQSGGGNTASVTVTGAGGQVLLNQNNNDGGAGNRATVNLAGTGVNDDSFVPAGALGSGNFAAIGQAGSGNDATITVNGGLNGTILQQGDDNLAELDVSGVGSSGSISQTGDNNIGNFDVTGANTAFEFIQQGTGLSTGAESVQVISNAAAVQITQTTFGGAGN